jgi:vacuolar-type H+-ATPase subunit E/Vma4
MSQQIQELINKIKSEGVEAAEHKGREIVDQARQQAQSIEAEARKKAEQSLAQAQEEVKRLQKSTHMALKQASRDTVLSLRKEIERMLAQIVKKELKDALDPEQMVKIVETAVKSAVDAGTVEGEVVIDLNEKDLAKLQGALLSRLQKQLKKGIRLQSSGDVAGGFTISFDDGRSSFDFSDESLANYLTAYLNAQTASLVKESVSS